MSKPAPLMLLALARTAGLHGLALATLVARRAAARLCAYLLILTLALAGTGFLAASAFLALSQALGHIYASLIMGWALIMAALVVLLILQTRRR